MSAGPAFDAAATADTSLAALREDIAAWVARDGADAHQVAVDAFVWAYAQAEAARSLRSFARDTAHPLARAIADVATDDALMLVDGGSIRARAARDERCAEIAAHLETLADLDTDDGHRMLRATLADFAAREIRPRAQDVHRRNLDVPESVIASAAALGLFGISVPQRYGGSLGASSDTLAMIIATEALSRGSLAIGGSLITRPEILVRALLRGGTEEQKRRWLPRIARGEAMVAVAVTEPDQGSDLAALRCRARKVAEGWQIDGTKLWSTFAGRAELLMLLCRTSDAGHRGLSLFVAEKPAFAGEAFEHRQEGRGVLRGRAIPTLGYRGMHTFELAFERYLVPDDALVGGESGRDRGFYLQLEGFSVGRLQTAGRAIGVTEAALDAAVAYADVRRVFGRRESEFPLVRAKIGAMAVGLEASRRLAYRAARLFGEDSADASIFASLAKLYASRVAERVTRDAMQLHGAMGYAEESEISRLFVDARVLAIFEGAEDVLSLRVVGRAFFESRSA